MQRRGPCPETLVAALVAVIVAGCGDGKQSRPAGGVPTRTALAQSAAPAGARGETLGLSRVVIPAGAKLPLHYHPGTQVAFVERGTLTYTVVRGRVDVMRGAAGGGARAVRPIGSGQTGTIGAGEWIVEQRSVVHRGANRGRSPVVVLLSTLLRSGSPPAVPVAGPG